MMKKNRYHRRNDHANRTEQRMKQQSSAPRKSVVSVYFTERNMTLPYYNDSFDLKKGDLVYVDGKLAGMRGRVTEVNYHFKIKIADYKRVVAVVDTEVHGEFFVAGSHFVTFDRCALPMSQVITWFKASDVREEFAVGGDGDVFQLADLNSMNVTSAVAQRGHQYYIDNRVKYISVDGSRGYALVEGGNMYEVEFEYLNGEIKNLYCDCFSNYHCKHEVAAMLQLKETLELIGKYYQEAYERTEYFAAICKGTLFSLAIDSRENGRFIL